jgi:hypothetical protein
MLANSVGKKFGYNNWSISWLQDWKYPKNRELISYENSFTLMSGPCKRIQSPELTFRVFTCAFSVWLVFPAVWSPQVSSLLRKGIRIAVQVFQKRRQRLHHFLWSMSKVPQPATRDYYGVAGFSKKCLFYTILGPRMSKIKVPQTQCLVRTLPGYTWPLPVVFPSHIQHT